MANNTCDYCNDVRQRRGTVLFCSQCSRNGKCDVCRRSRRQKRSKT
jgi:hypothetical protein